MLDYGNSWQPWGPWRTFNGPVMEVRGPPWICHGRTRASMDTSIESHGLLCRDQRSSSVDFHEFPGLTNNVPDWNLPTKKDRFKAVNYCSHSVQ